MIIPSCGGCDAVSMNVDYGKVCKERDELKAALAKVTAERDAAVEDMAQMLDNCKACAHAHDAPSDCDCECQTCRKKCACGDCRDGSRFEWRGVRRET